MSCMRDLRTTVTLTCSFYHLQAEEKELPPEIDDKVDVTKDDDYEALVKQEIKEAIIER